MKASAEETAIIKGHRCASGAALALDHDCERQIDGSGCASPCASVSLRVKRLFSPLRSASRAEVAVRPTTPLPDVACEGDATAGKIMCHD